MIHSTITQLPPQALHVAVLCFARWKGRIAQKNVSEVSQKLLTLQILSARGKLLVLGSSGRHLFKSAGQK